MMKKKVKVLVAPPQPILSDAEIVRPDYAALAGMCQVRLHTKTHNMTSTTTAECVLLTLYHYFLSGEIHGWKRPCQGQDAKVARMLFGIWCT